MALSMILEHIPTAISVITAISAFGIFIYTRVLKPIRNKMDMISTIDNKLESLTKTLGPNGGSSLYDKLTSIDRTVHTLNNRGGTLTTLLGVGEFTTDVDGSCIAVNEIICVQLGRPESDFLGANWMNVLFAEDKDRIVEDWKESVSNKKVFKASANVLQSDGDISEVKVIAKPIFNHYGKYFGFSGVVTFEKQKPGVSSGS